VAVDESYFRLKKQGAETLPGMLTLRGGGVVPNSAGSPGNRSSFAGVARRHTQMPRFWTLVAHSPA